MIAPVGHVAERLVVDAVTGLAIDVGAGWDLVVRDDEAADLRADGELVARAALQRRAEAPLGRAVAVEGRAVEVPDAVLPGAVDDAVRLLIRERGVEPADLGAPQAEARDLDAGAPDGNGNAWSCGHAAIPSTTPAASRLGEVHPGSPPAGRTA